MKNYKPRYIAIGQNNGTAKLYMDVNQYLNFDNLCCYLHRGFLTTTPEKDTYIVYTTEVTTVGKKLRTPYNGSIGTELVECLKKAMTTKGGYLVTPEGGNNFGRKIGDKEDFLIVHHITKNKTKYYRIKLLTKKGENYWKKHIDTLSEDNMISNLLNVPCYTKLFPTSFVL